MSHRAHSRPTSRLLSCQGILSMLVLASLEPNSTPIPFSQCTSDPFLITLVLRSLIMTLLLSGLTPVERWRTRCSPDSRWTPSIPGTLACGHRRRDVGRPPAPCGSARNGIAHELRDTNEHGVKFRFRHRTRFADQNASFRYDIARQSRA